MARLTFPVYLPTYNDKIVMRLWANTGSGADMFIANIPEFPDGRDFCNISHLIAKDGKMKPFWCNLYGMAPKDRNKKTAKSPSGSSFLGRLLISMHLVPNERP